MFKNKKSLGNKSYFDLKSNFLESKNTDISAFV